jgi:hypothetical protein
MSSTAEQKAIALGRGKWSNPDVPKTGWDCVRIEDRGAALDVCGMCESQRIRYVHHMSHPHSASELAVGCICAGHMEGDLEAARSRDRWMTQRSRHRSRWLLRKWNVSKNGNEWIESDGFRVIVFRKGPAWAGVVNSVDGTYKRFSKSPHPSVEAVKLAAFDVITHRLALSRSTSD